MSKLQHYALDFSRITQTIDEFFLGQSDCDYEFSEVNSRTYALRVWSLENGIRCKKPGVLTVYNKQGRYCMVVEGAPSLRKIVDDCKAFLIDNLRLPDSDLRCFVLRGVEKGTFDIFMEILREEAVVKDGNSVPEASHFVISDKYNSSVHITFYENGTLRMQGIFTALFLNLITTATEYLTTDSGQVIEELLRLGRQDNQRFATELTSLVTNAKPLIDNNLDGFVMTSATLANSNIEVADYACYSFGILKAIEGLLSIKLAEHIRNEKDSVGNYFDENTSSHVWHLIQGITDFDGNAELKKYIEKAYNAYKNNRHTTFHVRKIHVETSRVLSYEDAIDIIEDGLEIINGLCDNW